MSLHAVVGLCVCQKSASDPLSAACLPCHLVIAPHAKSRVLVLQLRAHAPVSPALQAMAEAFLVPSFILTAGAHDVVNSMKPLLEPLGAAARWPMDGLADGRCLCETAPRAVPGRTAQILFARHVASMMAMQAMARRHRISAVFMSASVAVRLSDPPLVNCEIEGPSACRSLLRSASLFWEPLVRLCIAVRVSLFQHECT